MTLFMRMLHDGVPDLKMGMVYTTRFSRALWVGILAKFSSVLHLFIALRFPWGREDQEVEGVPRLPVEVSPIPLPLYAHVILLSFFLPLTESGGLVMRCPPTIANLLRHALAKKILRTRKQDLRGDDSLCNSLI